VRMKTQTPRNDGQQLGVSDFTSNAWVGPSDTPNALGGHTGPHVLKYGYLPDVWRCIECGHLVMGETMPVDRRAITK
jgi:hypothetical protein